MLFWFTAASTMKPRGQKHLARLSPFEIGAVAIVILVLSGVGYSLLSSKPNESEGAADARSSVDSASSIPVPEPGATRVEVINPIRGLPPPRQEAPGAAITQEAAVVPPGDGEKAALLREPSADTAGDTGRSPSLPVPTSQARQVLANLLQISVADNVGSQGSTDAWQRNLNDLVRFGDYGAAAIYEYLHAHQDILFDEQTAALLGTGLLRETLIGVLGEIGSPAAQLVALRQLAETTSPREIALLAGVVDGGDTPAERAEILAAARRSLAVAMQEEDTSQDVAPLFDVFCRYGGEDVVPDLTGAAGVWNHYAAAALGRLSDGSGVAALTSMAQEPGITQLPAIQTLGLMSADNPVARSALLDMARADLIPTSNWPYLVDGLIGDEFYYADSVDTAIDLGDRLRYVPAGNQAFYQVRTLTTLTPDQINARLSVVEALRGSAGAHPAAAEALEEAKSILLQQLSQTDSDR